MKPEFNLEEFRRVQVELWIQSGWTAEQVFSDIGSIIEYKSIVIDVSSSSSDRMDYVRDTYSIYPDELFEFGEERYVIFRFKRAISSRTFYTIGNTICLLYNGIYDEDKVRTSYPFKSDKTYPLGQLVPLVGAIEQIGRSIDDATNKVYSDVTNKKEIDKVNSLNKYDVLKKLGRATIDKIDDVLDIIIWYGSIYTYVVKVLGDIDTAYEFFNTEYGTKFATGASSIDKFMTLGIVPDGSELYQQWSYLGYDTEKGFKKITDFIPRVHYRLQRDDSVTYIISVTWENGEVKKFIEAPNDSSESAMQKWIQSYGNYHLYGGKIAVWLLHKFLSSARVPTIYTVDKFGDIEVQWKRFIAYADSLYEVETGRVIERFPGTAFYMVSTVMGIRIEDRATNDLKESLSVKAPFLWKTENVNTPKSFVEFFGRFYQDDSKYMIPFIAATWLGHLLYKPSTSCPMFFVTWPTGSGKTTFTKLLSRIYWIEKPVSLEEATPFPIRFSLTQLDWLPVFFNEYRQKMNYAVEKTQIFKALFDWTPFERWRKDLGIDTFTFSANGFMEGEELPDSGATRTRLIIHKTKLNGIIKGSNPEKAMTEHAEFINNFQYSYFSATDEKEYFDFYKESAEIFGDIQCPSPRVYENIRLMYAGVMAFFREYREEVIRVLTKLMLEQIDDFNRNSTGAEFIWAVAKFVVQRFSKVYIEANHLIISWTELVDFIESKRVKLELWPDGYRDHLEAMWWQLGYYEVVADEFTREISLVDWMKIHIKDVPVALRCNTSIYKAYKEYQAKVVKS